MRAQIKAIRLDLAIIKAKVDRVPTHFHWVVLSAAWFVFLTVAV